MELGIRGREKGRGRDLGCRQQGGCRAVCRPCTGLCDTGKIQRLGSWQLTHHSLIQRADLGNERPSVVRRGEQHGGRSGGGAMGETRRVSVHRPEEGGKRSLESATFQVLCRLTAS